MKLKEFFNDKEKVENLKNKTKDVLCGMAAFGTGALTAGLETILFAATSYASAPLLIAKAVRACVSVAGTGLMLGTYKKVIEPTLEEEVDNTFEVIDSIVEDKPINVVMRYSEAKRLNEEANT